MARPRVVVIGSGFGGLNTVKGLRGAPVDITLIDRTNHHLFQPLLYQVATAALSGAEIAVPIRSIFRRQENVTVLMGEVDGIDVAGRRVSVRQTAMVPYDVLVLATGSVYSWFGHDDWATHSYALKTLDDAEELRLRLLGAFERAESRDDPAENQRLLTFVVVGGGPTGVELAGAISELARYTLARDFRRINPTAARVILCEAGPEVLPGFPLPLSRYARAKLGRLGVEVRTSTPVDAVDAHGIDAAGQRIEAANVLWAAGTEATPAAHWLGIEAARNGLLPIEPDCTVTGHPEIFAIGDVTLLKHRGKPLPALAPVAKQQGRYVARVIRARVTRHRAPGPFAYKDAGMLAILGRSAAVARLPGVSVTGFLAWFLWSAVHLLLLVGARNRVIVYVNWAWAWMTYSRGARLITGLDRRPQPGD